LILGIIYRLPSPPRFEVGGYPIRCAGRKWIWPGGLRQRSVSFELLKLFRVASEVERLEGSGAELLNGAEGADCSMPPHLCPVIPFEGYFKNVA
jgi:hypothetical protein